MNIVFISASVWRGQTEQCIQIEMKTHSWVKLVGLSENLSQKCHLDPQSAIHWVVRGALLWLLLALD